MEQLHIPRRSEKDENLVKEIKGMGCHLMSPPLRSTPMLIKLQPLLLATLAVNMGTAASPLGVAAVLEVAQWFCLLTIPHH